MNLYLATLQTTVEEVGENEETTVMTPILIPAIDVPAACWIANAVASRLHEKHGVDVSVDEVDRIL